MKTGSGTKYVITQMQNRTFFARFEDESCTGIFPVEEESVVGNIYIGRVENVVKNLNCAFVEVQKGMRCFYSLDDNKKHHFLNRKNNTAVNQGDYLLIQVVNDAVKTKPATVSSNLCLSGQYLVLSSDVSNVSISLKTKKDPVCIAHQNRLLHDFNFDVLKDELNVSPEQQHIGSYGLILRTNSVYAAYEDILKEAKTLVNCYGKIVKTALFGRAFTCLYMSPASYVDEILGTPIDALSEIVTDDRITYDMLAKSMPADIAGKLRLYHSKLQPLKAVYALEKELEDALRSKVWLNCGGYLVIEQTEALTVIDVNSGKCVNKKRSEAAKEETLAKVNFEAAVEIARQIRLRNLSGIIIIDFINMKYDAHNVELLTRLKQLLSADRIKTVLVDITKLGLVEITRQKNGKTLRETMQSQIGRNETKNE